MDQVDANLLYSFSSDSDPEPELIEPEPIEPEPVEPELEVEMEMELENEPELLELEFEPEIIEPEPTEIEPEVEPEPEPEYEIIVGWNNYNNRISVYDLQIININYSGYITNFIYTEEINNIETNYLYLIPGKEINNVVLKFNLENQNLYYTDFLVGRYEIDQYLESGKIISLSDSSDNHVFLLENLSVPGNNSELDILNKINLIQLDPALDPEDVNFIYKNNINIPIYNYFEVRNFNNMLYSHNNEICNS